VAGLIGGRNQCSIQIKALLVLLALLVWRWAIAPRLAAGLVLLPGSRDLFLSALAMSAVLG